MMVFHAFHHVLLWPGWRLKHLTPGDHFCRIWTLEPFFVEAPPSHAQAAELRIKPLPCQLEWRRRRRRKMHWLLGISRSAQDVIKIYKDSKRFSKFMWDRFECSGRCLRRVVCQGCWCRSFPKKSLDQKSTEWQFLVLCLTRKMKACRMTVFHAFHHVLSGPDWRWTHPFAIHNECFVLHCSIHFYRHGWCALAFCRGLRINVFHHWKHPWSWSCQKSGSEWCMQVTYIW